MGRKEGLIVFYYNYDKIFIQTSVLIFIYFQFFIKNAQLFISSFIRFFDDILKHLNKFFRFLSKKTYKMTQFLPDNLLGLFAPRAPIQYKPPPDDLFINRKHIPIDGIAEHVQKFEVSFLIVKN